MTLCWVVGCPLSLVRFQLLVVRCQWSVVRCFFLRASVPSCLRAFVPPCLRAFRWLSGSSRGKDDTLLGCWLSVVSGPLSAVSSFVPPCLRASVPFGGCLLALSSKGDGCPLFALGAPSLRHANQRVSRVPRERFSANTPNSNRERADGS
jgi:hypothetical protein